MPRLGEPGNRDCIPRQSRCQVQRRSPDRSLRHDVQWIDRSRSTLRSKDQVSPTEPCLNRHLHSAICLPARHGTASCTTRCRTDDFAATPAGTAVHFRTAPLVCARCATTRADASACPPATSAASRAIRSRRSRSSTSSPAPLALTLRHARLRFPLRLLPELGHVADAARPDGGRAAARDLARSHGPERAPAARAGGRQHATTSRSSRASGPSRSSRKPERPASPRDSSQTATPRRRCSTSSARRSISTRSISRPSTIDTIASSAACWTRFSTASACCRRWASGSRS